MIARSHFLRPAVPVLCAVLAAGALRAQAPEAAAGVAAPDSARTEQLKAMPELPDTDLGRVLGRYYERSLGGEENWERLNSLRVEGTITLGEQSFDFIAFQKKPNLLKAVLSGPGGDLINGYDGETAWRVMPGRDNAVQMSPEETRSFVHNANFDSFLLYPLAPGKTVEYLDVVPASGKLCHQIRVTLDTGFIVDYFIDIHNFYIIRSVSTDMESGVVTEHIYEDFTSLLGMPMAQTVSAYDDGELSSIVKVKAFKPNKGVMDWMFRMPKPVDTSLPGTDTLFQDGESDSIETFGFGN